MDIRKSYFLFIILTLYILSCARNKDPITSNEQYPSFGVYFLKDTTIKINQILSEELSKLKLQNQPWISDEDIEFYDFSSHSIYLEKDKSFFFPNLEYYYQFPKSWTDRPFIITANGVPCYSGYFSTIGSSEFWFAPLMEANDVGAYPADVIHYDWIWIAHPDPRNNDLVKDALIQKGLYHGGIKISIDTTNSPISIINDDTTTIEYTFTIKNNDQYNLYIFDPDLVVNEVFLFYNKGPVLLNIETDKVYRSNYKRAKNPEAWSHEWYTLLESGESIKRTIRLKGYPLIPSGTYYIELKYNTPVIGLEKDIRKDSEGRYWLGSTRSNILILTLNTNYNQHVI